MGSKTDELIEEILNYTKTSRPEKDGGEVFYPGENTLRNRAKSLREGVWVDERVWEKVKYL
jgi:3-dehydro-L-gulonate 2-dehydrogenase